MHCQQQGPAQRQQTGQSNFSINDNYNYYGPTLKTSLQSLYSTLCVHSLYSTEKRPVLDIADNPEYKADQELNI